MLAEKQRTRTKLREQSLQRSPQASGSNALFFGLGCGLLGLVGLALVPIATLAPNPQPEWPSKAQVDGGWYFRYATWTPERVIIEFRHGVDRTNELIYCIEILNTGDMYKISYVTGGAPDMAGRTQSWATSPSLEEAIHVADQACGFFQELRIMTLHMLKQTHEIMGS